MGISSNSFFVMFDVNCASITANISCKYYPARTSRNHRSSDWCGIVDPGMHALPTENRMFAIAESGRKT